MLGRRVGVRTWHGGATRLPFAARARLGRDIATASETSSHGGLAFGVFHPGSYEDDVCPVGKMWDQGFGQHERSEMVGCECHVPALSGLRSSRLEHACIVEQADDRKPQRASHSQCPTNRTRPEPRARPFSRGPFGLRRVSWGRPTRLASSSAMARPMPEVGPVTMYAPSSLGSAMESASGMLF